MRAVLVSTLAGAFALAACAARKPGPRPLAVASSSRDCSSCHAKETADWTASLHRAAFTDRDFQASFAHEPDGFCFRCHAPEAHDAKDTVGVANGVGCASCHVVAEGHGSEHVAARTRDCASCHEFSFPSRPSLMQSTVSEHARSASSASACASCHLPRATDGHRDHRFDVTRNVTLLRSAIEATARRTERGITVGLATKGVGHAMPTGDLFRRLRIVVRAEDENGSHLGEKEALLARRFDRLGGVPKEVEDTRVFGRRDVDIAGEWLVRAARIRVEVRYERVAQTFDVVDVLGERSHRDMVFASELLAEISVP